MKKDQARRPDGKFLKRRAFEKRLLPEPPRLKQPQAYILGRSPLRAFYYTKSARGRRGNNGRRAVEGMRWNYYLSTGKAIPKGTLPENHRAPPAVSGTISSMMASRERKYQAEKISLHEHQAPSPIALEIRQHTINSNHSTGTGWVDVPMPGMQTQYQQGSFVQLVDFPRQHTSRPANGQTQIQVASISLVRLPSDVPANPLKIETACPPVMIGEKPAESIKGTKADVQEAGAGRIAVYKPTLQKMKVEESAGMGITRCKPARLHFNPASNAKPGRQKAEKAAPKVPNTVSSGAKPERFKAETPRSEGIIASSEISVRASTPPAEYPAQQIRIEEIKLPGHIGYIPSVRKKERQLKVAQGSEAIPPQ